LLGMVLADHIVIENLADFLRRRDAVARFYQPGLVVLADDVHAQLDAFVADVDSCAGNELAQLVLALAAERAIVRVLGIAGASLAHLKTLDARRRSVTPQSNPAAVKRFGLKEVPTCSDLASQRGRHTRYLRPP